MKLLPYNHDMYIEPTDPITTPGEFSHQLILHFTQEGKGVTLLEPGMEPVIEVDGVTYVCRLGEPYRPVCRLCLLAERTPEEAALALGRPVKTIHTQRSRGKRMLREALERSGNDDMLSP